MAIQIQRSSIEARLSRVALAALALSLSACGGGENTAPTAVERESAAAVTSGVASGMTTADAARFLTQASFGPTDSEIQRVKTLGYAAWIDDQWTRPSVSLRSLWESADAARKAEGRGGAWQDDVLNAFWKRAVTGDDQLRQRVAYALSQIFVLSMQGANVSSQSRAVASYMDLLSTKGLTTYRQLLEGVSMHPMMGHYLSHLKNQKADPLTSRVPDENFAREVMQLFSIGLHQLNADGTVKTSGGKPIEAYGPADVAGMAKVFTGWSWACPVLDYSCFHGGSSYGKSDPDAKIKPMQAYPRYHSTEAKSFLGVTIPAQTVPAPAASLRVALDTLAAHPNVGPFIGRQLIQRLITSNPSPAYVAAVAQVFNDNGSGLRGDMKAVVKAVLLHPEARSPIVDGGKVREPVLRLSAFLRAFPFRSDSGEWKVANTDDPGLSLGQSALRSPSVFNFYRPGYVPPGTKAAAAGMAAPEMQIASETTAAGYVNYMRDNLSQGVGSSNGTINGVTYNRRDVQANFGTELSLAATASALVERVNVKLMRGQMPSALKSEIIYAVSSIAIPVLNSSGSNQAQIDAARRSRVRAAILLTLASPEFAVQS